MTRIIIAVFVAAVTVFAWFSLPVPPRPEASGGHASHAVDPAALADGVVLSIDSAEGRVTISHGPLHNLGMPPMTMGFQVADAALLEGLKPGDKVRFHPDAIAGAFTVTRIEIAN